MGRALRHRARPARDPRLLRQCYAPFEGDNGGVTSPGVTADTIKLVWYLAPEQDPIINYITDAIAGDDTNDQRIETMENVVRFYHTYYELYGRRIELIPFQGTGFAIDEVAARADAVRIAEEIEPFAVLSARLDHGLQRRAGCPAGHVHRLRADPTDELLRRA